MRIREKPVHLYWELHQQGFSLAKIAKRYRVRESVITDLFVRYGYVKAIKSTHQSRCKPIRRIDTGEVYPSVSSAANAVKLAKSSISLAVNSGGKSAGTHWEYIND